MEQEQKLDAIMDLLTSVTAVEHLDNGPVHPPFSELGYFGYTCLLVGAICMAVSTLYFYQAALKAGPGKMKFEVISMMVTGIATVLYMTMFSGAGKSFVKELGHDINPHDTRDAFYWGRYVDWILTTPLMLWDVLALAGAPSDDILAAVGVDVLMIGFGAVGAQTPSAQKWVFFVCGMLCFGHVVKVLLKYTTVTAAGKEAQSLYCKVAYLTIVLWTLYPLVWIVSEGGRLVSPSLEACLYMIMDVSAKCIFGFMIVGARDALEKISATDFYIHNEK